jgi:spore coat polysaccharide biosynthesis predicted glycosyltransferase SpsG
MPTLFKNFFFCQPHENFIVVVHLYTKNAFALIILRLNLAIFYTTFTALIIHSFCLDAKTNQKIKKEICFNAFCTNASTTIKVIPISSKNDKRL